MKWEAINTNMGYCVEGEWRGTRRYIAQMIPEEWMAELMAAAPELPQLVRKTGCKLPLRLAGLAKEVEKKEGLR